VCIVAAGEEMSWGQRIFNFQTPDFIARANRQSEFNLHNLFVLSGGSSWRYFFKTGQFDWRQIFDAQNLFRIGFLTFFFLCVRRNRAEKSYLDGDIMNRIRPSVSWQLCSFYFLS